MKLVPVYKHASLHDWVKVDDADYPAVIARLWKVSGRGYAVNAEGCGSLLMHRFILGLDHSDPRDVDHINHDKFDNRRENLRPVTRRQNAQNRKSANKGSTSKYRGVSYCKITGRWIATVGLNYQLHWLGRHDTEEEAAAVASAFRAEHMPFSEDARARQSTPVVESDERKAA